jgi:uncharacterized protein (DUF2141 family)
MLGKTQKLFLNLGILASVLGQVPFATSADLTVIAAGIDHDEGAIEFRMFKGKEGWLKTDDPNTQILRKDANRASNGAVIVTFRDLEPGYYGLSVYHDENSNGDIDRGMFTPKEGWALSNNIKPVMSMPSYEKGRVLVPEEGARTSVILDYP